ncbi:hypothetical protein KDW_21310 [Dictyobacter vulcani]|uniref:Uncharacterized protein n=1 Tax=Dictyobacter vulcani TaxID=2607529 RepID=A0A5J4KPD1_9CHLR|nr:hypothetical protein [Dictyobacter vulcani]GER87969.1 hypothetical protein KDW_21310 [Dictyobacter vulcani]
MPINGSHDEDKQKSHAEKQSEISNNASINDNLNEQNEAGEQRIVEDAKPVEHPKRVIPKRPSARTEPSSSLQKEIPDPQVPLIKENAAEEAAVTPAQEIESAPPLHPAGYL